ncbi:CAP domain-containing protein [Streptomyces sp. NPDC051704]|uniref:CAP domain-containing protein n=1 Tax=Streptomyces sp. NPDC051704 TaxID=3365671 RepID=UPI0037A07C9F
MGRHRLHAAPVRDGNRRTLVRTALLGGAVAVALGTAAVTTGMVPVGGSFPYVGVSADGSTAKTQAGAGAEASPSPAAMPERQGGLANLSGRASAGPDSDGPSRSASPSASPSVSPSPSAPPSPSASPTPPASPTPSASAPASAKVQAKPQKSLLPVPVPVPPKTAAPKPPAPPAPTTPAAPPAPSATPAPTPGDGHSAEESAVVTLVNQERAQAGCGPVRANPPLAALAGAFSKDMAVRGFFDHTDPDGNTPWDRATKAGLSGLGGENIARGQGDAQAVMNAWMNSPGHKANILNCEFRTLGVGVYVADGGPWWTQDFGL